MIEQSTLAFVIKVGLMAFFAAIVHALNQYRTGASKTWKDTIILGVISFFFGVVTGLVTIHLLGDTPMLYGVIGIAGWLGVEMSSILTQFLIKKLK